MIFYERFDNRISFWQKFRENLETDLDPIQTTINFWNTAPISSMSCDPFDKETWLGAWQLIDENNYCDFSKILAIYHTLSLTDRFKDCHYEIKIAANSENQTLYYLLFVDDTVIGYLYDKPILKADLPDLWVQYSYVMTDHLE
jgi:hypothetical protein